MWTPWWTPQAEYRRLFRIIRERAKADPAAVAKKLFGGGISIGLLVYVGFRAGDSIRATDSQERPPARSPIGMVLPIEVEKELLPSFMAISAIWRSCCTCRRRPRAATGIEPWEAD